MSCHWCDANECRHAEIHQQPVSRNQFDRDKSQRSRAFIAANFADTYTQSQLDGDGSEQDQATQMIDMWGMHELFGGDDSPWMFQGFKPEPEAEPEWKRFGIRVDIDGVKYFMS